MGEEKKKSFASEYIKSTERCIVRSDNDPEKSNKTLTVDFEQRQN